MRGTCGNRTHADQVHVKRHNRSAEPLYQAGHVRFTLLIFYVNYRFDYFLGASGLDVAFPAARQVEKKFITEFSLAARFPSECAPAGAWPSSLPCDTRRRAPIYVLYPVLGHLQR